MSSIKTVSKIKPKKKKQLPAIKKPELHTFTPLSGGYGDEWMENAGVPCSHCHHELTVFYFNMENWGWGYTEIPLCWNCMKEWFRKYDERIRGKRNLTQAKVLKLLAK